MSLIGWTKVDRCPLCKSRSQHAYSMFVYRDEDAELASKYVEVDENGMITLRAVICECGFVYTDEYLDDLDRYYAEAYQPILEERIGRLRTADGEKVILGDEEYRAERIAERLQDGHGREVLDVGCGSGKLMARMSEKGWYVYGLDPREQDLPTWKSLEDIPEDKKFDLIVMSHVLEHIPDPIPWLEQFKGRLKPNGQIFIEVPSFGPNNGTLSIHHVGAYTVHTIQDVLMKAGYQILAVGQVPVMVKGSDEEYKVVLQANARAK